MIKADRWLVAQKTDENSIKYVIVNSAEEIVATFNPIITKEAEELAQDICDKHNANLKDIVEKEDIENGYTPKIDELTLENYMGLNFVDINESRNMVFDELMFISTEDFHDSGYRIIHIIGCRKGEAVCRLNKYSDVLLCYGNDCSIDCLPNGFFRIWCPDRSIKINSSLSDFRFNSVEVTER